MALAASYTPDMVAVAPIVVGHAATAEMHVPCVAGMKGVGSRRPVVVGLHIDERMPGWEGRAILCRVYQAGQLLYGGQPPALTTT